MYLMSVQFIGGYGKYGFDYYYCDCFDTYQPAYNALRRWRRKCARENIEADMTIKRH